MKNKKAALDMSWSTVLLLILGLIILIFLIFLVMKGVTSGTSVLNKLG